MEIRLRKEEGFTLNTLLLTAQFGHDDILAMSYIHVYQKKTQPPCFLGNLICSLSTKDFRHL